MDTERSIAEIEYLERIFAVPDSRPLSPSDLSAANRRHDRHCAARRDLSNRRTMEFDGTAVRGAFGIQQSVVAFANSDDLPAKSSGRIHSTVNHRVDY